jgi:hypothetical protein
VSTVVGFVASVLGILAVVVTTNSWAQTRIQLRREKGDLQRRQEEEVALGPIGAAVKEQLRAASRAAFWPSFWANLGINFVSGLVFFVLGIVTTVYFGIGR